MKKLMVLGASILQLPAIEKALEMGLEVIAVDMNPKAVGFDVDGVYKEVISTIDTPAVLEAARKHQIDGIMTLASDMPMQTVATVCKELGLVGITQETALKATNKAYMRDALKEKGVPIPLYYRVRGKESFLDAVKKVFSAGYKCIVKPADNSGSRGVNLLHDENNLERAYNYTMEYSRSGEMVVEEFMEGPEVSVETIAIKGKVHVIQITDKLTTGAPYFVEMGHSQPSQLPNKVLERIRTVATQANEAIGISDGPSHTEIKVTKSGPKVVELGARLGGDCITSHLVPLSTGIDMVKCCIQISLGEVPNICQTLHNGAAIRYFRTDQGIIDRIEGVHELRQKPGIINVSIVHGVGERADSIKSSTDRVGFVITQCNTVREAVQSAEEGIKSVRFYCKSFAKD